MDMTSASTSSFETAMMAPSGSSTTYTLMPFTYRSTHPSPGNGSSLPIGAPKDDAWDDFPWTDEQRRQIESGLVPRHVLVLLGLVLSVVVAFGLVANATILYVFSR